MSRLKLTSIAAQEYLIKIRLAATNNRKKDASKVAYNPFYLTKVWPHKDYPLIEVGIMELNCNPENFLLKLSNLHLILQRWYLVSAFHRTKCGRHDCSLTAMHNATD